MKYTEFYKPADELRITNSERTALIELSRELVDGSIAAESFGMASWTNCICGHMRNKLGMSLAIGRNPASPAASGLFTGHTKYFGPDPTGSGLKGRTRADASRAIQNFLLGIDADT
jgi:hypothetical protein